MLTKKYNSFQREVKKQVRSFKKKKKISEAEFDSFIKKIISNKTLDAKDKIYCRDGFVYINEIDACTFQILCFQINSFGAGIFGKSLVKLCTPIMLTVTVRGTHQYARQSLKDTCISVDEFYLGKHYSGSKGTLCDREKFNSYAKTLFLSKSEEHSFNHNTIYNLMNANYLCHHIAEVMGYAFGALDERWAGGKGMFFLTAASWSNGNKDKLYLNIIENFSGDKMSGHFQVPCYAKLVENSEKFKEEFDNLLCTISYKKELETFYLPIGYQKVQKKRFNKNVKVITSQHILEHLLASYYKRKNAFVVTNTFQTLEYLSRALIAKSEGKDKEFNDFMRTVTSCQGYYPERDFEEIYKKKETKYPTFIREYSHTMFFRAPILQ